MISKIIAFVTGNVQAFLIGLTAFVLLGAGIFIKGCNYGENRKDAEYKTAISEGKLVERSRDTTSTPQAPVEGHFGTQTLKDPTYDAKVRQAVQAAYQRGKLEASQQHLSDLDSANAVISILGDELDKAYQPKLGHIKTPSIGELWFTFYPVDSTANVFRHEPPPLKTIYVTNDKLVLVPRSNLETAGYVVAGAGFGIAAATSDPKSRLVAFGIGALAVAYELLK